MVNEKVQVMSPSDVRRLFDLAQKMPDVISFGIGEPDFDTPEHIRKAAAKALEEGYTHYTPTAGFLELRQAIAEKLKKENGIDADPKSEIIVTVGGAGAIFLAIFAILNPREEVLVPDPGFLTYAPCAILAGAKPASVQLREKEDFRMLPEEVEKHITPKTKCLILNSPANPTGSVMLRKDLEALSDIALKHELFVVSDEVYEKMIYDGSEHFSIASIPGMEERTVTVNSFSKTYAMAGWRVGYAIAPKLLIENMAKIQQNMVANAPAVAQKAALAALTGHQDCVREMVSQYDSRRRYLVKRLNEIEGISCRTPKGAFYVFANIKLLRKSSKKVAETFLTEGKVVTVPGTAFGKYGEGYLRLCYATPMEKLEKGIDRIEKAANKILR